VNRERTFSLSEVVSQGFEARCVAEDGALYFWHRTFGVRIETRTGKASLLTDPRALPDARWVATSLGEKEIEAAAKSADRR
jgi:hypothetical protein